MGQPDYYLPTPEEIERMKKEFQDSWSDSERARRQCPTEVVELDLVGRDSRVERAMAASIESQGGDKGDRFMEVL